MIYIDLMGGLGNQLFQLFATISYAMKNKQPFCFPNDTMIGKRFTYWNSFLKNFKQYTIPYTSDKYQIKIIKENGFVYNPLPPVENNKNICLNGYFQTEKYFKEYYNKICQILQFDTIQNEVKYKYKEKITENYSNTIGMHFRLGDYKNLPDYHPILSYNYYKNAIRHIIETTGILDFDILYFCEKEDNDRVNIAISLLKREYPLTTFKKVLDVIEDWEQMIIMSLCKHTIIANSSFSWWGAYFNSNMDKIVCYPDTWFGVKGPTNIKDLCPDSWTKISNNKKNVVYNTSNTCNTSNTSNTCNI